MLSNKGNALSTTDLCPKVNGEKEPGKTAVFFMISKFRGPQDAFEPLGGPKVSKSITF